VRCKVKFVIRPYVRVAGEKQGDGKKLPACWSNDLQEVLVNAMTGIELGVADMVSKGPLLVDVIEITYLFSESIPRDRLVLGWQQALAVLCGVVEILPELPVYES
jgi:hypothetical protein